MTPIQENPTNATFEEANTSVDKPIHDTNLGGRVSQVTDQVKSTATHFGQSAAQNIDRTLDRVVGALRSAASSLRSQTPETTRMNGLAHTTANKLDATAEYFQHHHTREMMSDVQHLVRRNPGASLAVALGLGFVIGMSRQRGRRYY